MYIVLICSKVLGVYHLRILIIFNVAFRALTDAINVVANGDKYGVKAEALVNDILHADPNMKFLDGAKYGGNNGLDHVV